MSRRSRAAPGLAGIGAPLLLPLVLAACAGPTDPYAPLQTNRGIGYQDRPNPDGGFTLTIITPAAGGPDLARQLFDRRAQELCDHQVAGTNTFRADRRVGYDQYRNVVLGEYVLEGYVTCSFSGEAPNPAPAAAGASAVVANGR